MAGLHCDSLALLPAVLAVILTECKTTNVLTSTPNLDMYDADFAAERTTYSTSIAIGEMYTPNCEPMIREFRFLLVT